MIKKRVNSYLLSLVLAFAMVFGTGVLNLPETGLVAAEEKEVGKITVYVALEGKDDQGHEVDVDKTPVQVEAGTKADEAVKQVLQTAGYTSDDYIMEDGGYGVNLNGVGGVNNLADWSYYWGLFLNGTYASDSLGNIVLQDNDKISYVYVAITDSETTGAAAFADDTSKNPDSTRQEELLAAARKQQDVLAEAIFQNILDAGNTIYGIENPDALYVAFSLIRAGYPAQDCYNRMLEKVTNQLQEIKENGKTDVGGSEISEETILDAGNAELTYAKIALFVTAMGKPATDIGGYNLIDTMAKKSVYEGSSSYYTTACTTLLALDSADYALPVGEDYITRAELVNSLAGQMDSVIGTALQWSSPDMVAMLLQPLGTYMVSPVTAQAAVDEEALNREYEKGVHFLESMQASDGTWSSNNVWTLAQIMTAMGQLGINPASEEDETDFIKNGVTALDNVSAFVNTEESKVDEDLMGYQPEQLLRGLNAVIRVMEGRSALYHVTDSGQPTPSAGPSESAVPSVSPQAPVAPSASVQPSGSAAPSATPPSGVASLTPTPSGPTVCPTAPPSRVTVKKIKAVKSKVTVKKGKKKTLKWRIIWSKNKKKSPNTVKVSMNKKYLKVLKNSWKDNEVRITVQGRKKGVSTVKISVGGKSGKIKVTVK